MVTWLSGEPVVPQSYLGVHGVNLMVVNPLGAEPNGKSDDVDGRSQ